MTIKPLIPLAAIAVAGAGTAALAAAPRDTLVKHRIAYSELVDGVRNGASVSFYIPATWQALRQTDERHLSFRVARTGCSYSVTFTTRQAPDTTETPGEHVAEALPAASLRLIDQGVRGSAAAWRVTHPASDDGRVHLAAMRADHRSLGAGRRAWQETIVSAVSRKGSECHAGTYRNALGPQIGDALAAAAGRIYSFRPRS